MMARKATFVIDWLNIAKGTTDPRVEFILQDHSSRFTNLEHIREAVKNVLADFVR